MLLPLTNLLLPLHWVCSVHHQTASIGVDDLEDDQDGDDDDFLSRDVDDDEDVGKKTLQDPRVSDLFVTCRSTPNCRTIATAASLCKRS